MLPRHDTLPGRVQPPGHEQPPGQQRTATRRRPATTPPGHDLLPDYDVFSEAAARQLRLRPATLCPVRRRAAEPALS